MSAQDPNRAASTCLVLAFEQTTDPPPEPANDTSVLAVEGWKVLWKLEAAGELRIEGARVLPPAPEEGR